VGRRDHEDPVAVSPATEIREAAAGTVQPAALSDRNLLRSRHSHRHHKVTAVELFFDLVFVFAVTQLSQHLRQDFSVTGAVQVLLLLVAVWWVWIYTTWVTNWLNPDKLPVRVVLLVLMLPGLIGSSAIPHAFDSHGLAVALAYLTMQVGRTLFFIWAAKGHTKVARNFQRVLTWLLLGGILWIAGACVEGSQRLWWWGTALALEFISPWLGFWVPGLGRSSTSDWDIEGGYMAERCGLFIIIALGESILVTGLTFSRMAWTVAGISTLLVSFTVSIAMWWLYFDTTSELGLQAISRSDDPGRLARFVYTYVHLLLIAGIIVSAVADSFVLRDPLGPANTQTTVALLGSTGLYLLGILLFLHAVTDRFPLAPVLGLMLTLALVPVAPHIPPVLLMGAVAVVLFAIALHESTWRVAQDFGVVGVSAGGMSSPP
jgi:low temperature requirement protein LtrA